LALVTIKHLLEAGVHFGHKTRRWNPKMKPFIFEARDGIYIFDLQKTMEQLNSACNFVRETVKNGKSVLFVGTKKQAKDPIAKAGLDTQMHYVTERWLGGTLTNNITIRKSIQRMRQIDGVFEGGAAESMPKKEISSLTRERARFHKNLEGIKDMQDLPGVVFIVDPKREKIATAEARRLGIGLVGLVDTNCDPDVVDYPIPGNDDAMKSVSLITGIIAKVVQEALQEREKLGLTLKENLPEMMEDGGDAGGQQSRRPRRRRGDRRGRDRKRGDGRPAEGGFRGEKSGKVDAQPATPESKSAEEDDDTNDIDDSIR
jgi:small subunit ribosomal protein S2